VKSAPSAFLTKDLEALVMTTVLHLVDTGLVLRFYPVMCISCGLTINTVTSCCT